MGRESSNRRDNAQEGLTRVVVWPGDSKPTRGPLNCALAEAALRPVSIEDDFEAVVMLQSDGALDLVFGLRSAGFRGVIVAVLPDTCARLEGVLRTAGVNVVVNSVGAGLVHIVRAQDASQVSRQGIPFELHEGTRQVRLGVVDTVLSEAQYRILAVLSQESGRWWKAKEIIAAALGTNHAEDSSLVRVHMNGIRKQVGIARWCLQSERTFGYQLVTSADALMRIGSRRSWSNGHPGREWPPQKRASCRVPTSAPDAGTTPS